MLHLIFRDFWKPRTIHFIDFPRDNTIFYKISMFGQNVKNRCKNLFKTFPKPSQNYSKSSQNLKKTSTKRKNAPKTTQKHPTSVQDASKFRKLSQHELTWRPGKIWNPLLDGIREPLPLLRKERQTHCYLRKPIQVSLLRFKPLVKGDPTRVRGRNPHVLLIPPRPSGGQMF